MQDREIVRGGSRSMAAYTLTAVILVVGLIALFVWQPWNRWTTALYSTSTNDTTTTGRNR